MSQSNKPITPKADHRVIEAEATHQSQQNHTDSRSTGKGNDKPLKAKFSLGEWLANSRLVRWLRNLVWLFLIAVVAMLAYLSWSNNQNDWQIEHINELQSQMSQLKGSVKTLQNKQDKLEQALLNRADSPQAAEAPDVLSKIEAMDGLQNQVNALQAKLSDVESRLATTTNTPFSEESSSVVASKPSQAVEPRDPLNAFRQTLDQMKSQLIGLKSAQQALESKNETLSASLAAQQARPQKASQAQFVGMTKAQVQQWVAEINLQWVMQGDVEQTRLTLKALEQTVGSSQLPEKNRLIRQIGEDLNALTNATSTSSLDSAKQALKQTKNWLAQLDMTPVNTSRVSHETPPPEMSQPETSVWQKIEQKLLSLFSIKKRENSDNLTTVEKLVQQDVLKQRMLLLLDRVEWAMDSGSQQQLENSRQALIDYLSRQLPQKQAAFMELFKPIKVLHFQPRQSLKIVGEE